MHRRRFSWFAAPLFVSLGLSPAIGMGVEAPKPTPVDGKIKWVYDYGEGQRLSKESGKPMFVVFRCER